MRNQGGFQVEGRDRGKHILWGGVGRAVGRGGSMPLFQTLYSSLVWEDRWHSNLEYSFRTGGELCDILI